MAEICSYGIYTYSCGMGFRPAISPSGKRRYNHKNYNDNDCDGGKRKNLAYQSGNPSGKRRDRGKQSSALFFIHRIGVGSVSASV